MEDLHIRPCASSGVKDSKFLTSVQVGMLETKLGKTHSETKKAQAALDSLPDLTASRVQASEAELDDSRTKFNLIKGVRHIIRKSDWAPDEKSNWKTGFDSLLDVVGVLKSALSDANASELEYVKEIRRLNELLQRAEADTERLKHRYRVATYVSVGKAAKRYQDTTILATRDGKVREDDRTMQADFTIDIQQAQPIDTEDEDVDDQSPLALNGDKGELDFYPSIIHTNQSEYGITNGAAIYSEEVDAHKELSMMDAEPSNFEVVKEGTSRGSNSTNSGDHILDSPIGDDFDFEHDTSINMARFNNSQTVLSQFSPDTLACLMELEEPFATLKTATLPCLIKGAYQEYNLHQDLSVAAAVVGAGQEYNDGLGSIIASDSTLLNDTPSSPMLKAEIELAKELREIDFLDLEDILGKDFSIKRTTAQDEVLIEAFQQQGVLDLSATKLTDDPEAVMEPFQGEEYFTPDSNFDELRYNLNIKGEAILDTELPPAVLQVGINLKHRVVKGGNYLKKPFAKNIKGFSRRRFKGSKSFTELGPFESLQERDAAIRSNKRYAGRHDRTFPDLFRHGITYKPSATDTNVYRTIHISNLPSNITLFRLLTRIRGGAIVSAVICDTIKIIGSKSALVTFQDAYAASAYVKFAADYPVGFEYQRMEVTLVPTPTWPMPIPVQKRMEDKRQTRCLNIPSFISPNPDPLTPVEEEKRNQYLINLLKEELSSSNKLSFEAIYDAHVDDENTLHMSFASIQAAGTAYGILQREGNKVLGDKAFFVADPCAKPLLDLVDPEKLKVFLDSTDVEESDIVVEDLTDSEDFQGAEGKYYGGEILDKIDSAEKSGHHDPVSYEDVLKMELMPRLKTGDVVFSDYEALAIDKADVQHHKVSVTIFESARQEVIPIKELAGVSDIPDTPLPNQTSSSARTDSREGSLHTPSNSILSISSDLPILTPRSSVIITPSQDIVKSESSTEVTVTNNLDLSILNTAAGSFAFAATSTLAVSQRVKTRPERQSWADIMIEEAEMEQIPETNVSQVQTKNLSDSAVKASTPISSSLAESTSKDSSTAPSRQAKCTACPNIHVFTEKSVACVTAGESANGGTPHGTNINSATSSQAVSRVFCAPVSTTGPIARVTNAGIGGMRACACNGNECCVSGCLCSFSSAF